MVVSVRVNHVFPLFSHHPLHQPFFSHVIIQAHPVTGGSCPGEIERISPFVGHQDILHHNVLNPQESAGLLVKMGEQKSSLFADGVIVLLPRMRNHLPIGHPGGDPFDLFVG